MPPALDNMPHACHPKLGNYMYMYCVFLFLLMIKQYLVTSHSTCSRPVLKICLQTGVKNLPV
jgi:hypothetical protein